VGGLSIREPHCAGKISPAVLAGDGIGPEITAATVRVLQAVARHGGLDLALTPYPSWRACPIALSRLVAVAMAGLSALIVAVALILSR
jgi:hypothetical protein